MYVKDNVIEEQIDRDLEIQNLKGRIEEVENELDLLPEGSINWIELKKRAEKLRGELELLLQDLFSDNNTD